MKPPKRSSPTTEKLYLVLRSGWWHYRRRVPKRFRALDGQDFAAAATGCREHEYAQAVAVARELNASTEHRWQMLAEGLEPSAIEVAYAKAVERARDLGFTYRHRDALIAGDPEEIVRRVLALKDAGLSRTPAAVEAVLGTADEPELMLSQLHIRFFEVTPDKQQNHNPRTNANWRNRRRRAVELALDTIGDKPIRDLSRNDALSLRKDLFDAATAGEFQNAYVNKVFGCLSAMFREISDQGQLELVDPFGGLRLTNAADEQRVPYDNEYVAKVLLGPDALKGLNEEARAVVALMASTGMRPIEFAYMKAENIVLDAKVPHLRIVDGLKTKTSKRDMPLVGSALAAVKAFPNGLPTYFEKNDALTSTIGKYFRENDLNPTDEHSLYSLRHTFKDRLKDAGTPEEMIDQLMGHGSKKPKYGKGYSLKALVEYLERAAFDAPKWLV